MSLFKPEHMSIEEIIEKLEEAVNLGDSPHRGPFGTHIRKEYLVEAIEKLRTYPDAQPNEPLTLEELKEMDGEPVLVDRGPGYRRQWALVQVYAKSSDIVYLTLSNGAVLHLKVELKCGTKIYRRPPKEDKNEPYTVY